MGCKIKITPAQEQWLKIHFKHTNNEVIAEKLGMSVSTIGRRARSLGLTKSKQHFNKTLKKASAVAKEIGERTGYSAQSVGRYRQIEKWKAEHADETMPGCFKKGISLIDRIGIEKEKLRVAHAKESRRKSIERDARRIRLGLPPLLAITREKRLTSSQVNYRSKMKKAGYITMRNDQRVFYTESTARNIKMERRAFETYGLQVVPYRQAK